MALDYTQANRLMSVTTPLGADKLFIERCHGVEQISGLFTYKLDLLGKVEDMPIGFDKVLGQAVTVQVTLADGTSKRYVNGIVSRFAQGHQLLGPNGLATFVKFRAEVVPKLWLLTRKVNSRIFQQKNVPDILQEVLTGFTVKFQLEGTYEPRDYCVQYRETDFAFASRLMEEEGIYYYFEHAAGDHPMIVGDTPGSHKPVPGPTTLLYEGIFGGNRPDDRVFVWEKAQELRSGKVTFWDHCFEKPGDHLEATRPIAPTVQVGTVSHKLAVGGNGELEIYDYPGAYAQRFDGVDPGGGDRAGDLEKIGTDGTRTAGIRMEQEAVPGLLVQGESSVRHLTAGHKFTLDRHYDANGSFVVTRVEHDFHIAAGYTGGGSSGTAPAPGGSAGEPRLVNKNKFEGLPAGLPFRPVRATPKARVRGTHTATVVGPSGEEIFTDKYGRVKVQFHWDRLGTNDQNSSCWVRVGTIWAGKKWGAIHIPRIGQEVIVDFLESDPDQPIIIGSVYNAEQMPPYDLPDEKTKSGIKSRSTLQGAATDFNELRFQDKKGDEDIYFHAQKDFHRRVEHDDDELVENNMLTYVTGVKTIHIEGKPADLAADGGSGGDQGGKAGVAKDAGESASKKNAKPLDGVGLDFYIKKGHRHETLDEGDDILLMKKGNRSETLKLGNDTLLLEKGNRSETLKEGNETYEITKGNRQETLKDGNETFEITKGDRSHTLKQGNETIVLTQGNRDLSLKQGNETRDVKGTQTITVQDDRTLKVTKGNEVYQIAMGNQTIKIDMGNRETTIAMGNDTTKVSLGKSSTEAMQSIELKVGANSIKIDQTGVTIKGIMVTIEGTAMAEVKAPMTTVKGDGMLTLKGGITMIN